MATEKRKPEDIARNYKTQSHKPADNEDPAQEREVGPRGESHDRQAREQEAGDQGRRRD